MRTKLSPTQVSNSDGNGKTKIIKDFTPQPFIRPRHQKKFGQGNQSHENKKAKVHTKECLSLAKDIK